jgi:5,6-dimethylbenzimidazole synthase
MELPETLSATRANPHQFTADERASLYKTIFNRRDVRGQFLPDPVPDGMLARMLMAAHHAPSVGFMQPWDFILVKDRAIREQVHDAFRDSHQRSALMFEKDRRDTYKSLKLEGILESPVNICITCDRERAGPAVIGRTVQREMDLYSSVCAVQNFWLAARAEGVGVGWVSIIEHERLKQILGLPDHVQIVAYLCVGYVSHFLDRPELETAGWRKRLPLVDLVHADRWGTPLDEEAENSLVKELRRQQENT